jgi:hypothetical protein
LEQAEAVEVRVLKSIIFGIKTIKKNRKS